MNFEEYTGFREIILIFLESGRHDTQYTQTVPYGLHCVKNRKVQKIKRILTSFKENMGFKGIMSIFLENARQDTP